MHMFQTSPLPAKDQGNRFRPAGLSAINLDLGFYLSSPTEGEPMGATKFGPLHNSKTVKILQTSYSLISLLGKVLN